VLYIWAVEQRDFAAGISVSALGLGAGQIGAASLPESQVEELLLGALDLGITLFDTAPSYGLSEERLGRHLHQRRDEAVLSTKVGYGVEGTPDWTGECIRLGVDAALGRLHTDWIDIVHLHSCPADVLRRDDVIAQLVAAKEAGKARCIAYSGDNDDLDVALGMGVFDSVQTSLSFCDQRSIDMALPKIEEHKMGLIAKRPLANAPWRYENFPEGQECAEYWQRYEAMRIEPGEVGWHSLAIRFAAFTPLVGSIITGTKSLAHLCGNAEALAHGPLEPGLYQHIKDCFDRAGPWPQKI